MAELIFSENPRHVMTFDEEDIKDLRVALQVLATLNEEDMETHGYSESTILRAREGRHLLHRIIQELEAQDR